MNKGLAQIEAMIETGESHQALEKIESFLALGPNNIEALKLKAKALQRLGAFDEEVSVWSKVARIDQQDEDLIGYLEQRSREEREFLFFTEDDGQGGRVFYGYSRALMMNAAYGLMGCLLFLIYSKLASAYVYLAQPELLLGTFGLLVMVPWVAIGRAYAKSLHSVTLGEKSVLFRGRFKQALFDWDDIETITVVPRTRADQSLSLVFRKKDGQTVDLDISPDTSSIRGRSYFLHEIKLRCPRLAQFLRLMPGENPVTTPFRW